MKRKRNSQPKQEDKNQPAVHQNFFLKREQMEVAESILPGTLKRTLDAFDKQQAHDHKIDNSVIKLHQGSQRQESSDSLKAFIVILLFGGVLAALLLNGQKAEASIFGGFFIALGLLARAVRKKA